MLNGASKQRLGSSVRPMIPLLSAFTTPRTVISYRFRKQWRWANQLQSSYGVSGLYWPLQRRYLFHVQYIFNYVKHKSNITFRFKLNTLETYTFQQSSKFPLWISSNFTYSMRSPPRNDFLVHPLLNHQTYIMFWVQDAVSSQLTFGTFKLTTNAEFITVVLCKRSYVNPSRIWVAKHWPTYDILQNRRLLTNVFVIVDIHIHPGQNTPRSHTFTSNVNKHMSAYILTDTTLTLQILFLASDCKRVCTHQY
jgi:hypothetical protein